MGSQHPSPNVKNLWNLETQIWLEMITSRDAESACFKGSQTSCTENNFLRFFAEIWPKKITSRDGCVLLIIPVWVLLRKKEKRRQVATARLDAGLDEIQDGRAFMSLLLLQGDHGSPCRPPRCSASPESAQFHKSLRARKRKPINTNSAVN